MSSPADFDLDVRDEMARIRSSGTIDHVADWFQRMWGVAVVAHIVGNPRVRELSDDVTVLGAVSFATGMLAIAAILRPDDRRLLAGLALAVPVTVWLEAPVLGNHWLLAGFVSLVIGAALALRKSWEWFSSTARAIHLVFYGFVAFAKLNTDFFDPVTSCAAVFTNQTIGSFGLPTVTPGSDAAALLPYAVVGIELMIPVLLVIRRTRFAGVVVGLAFHSLLSFDLGQHVYDFTAVLFPLFLLWLAPRDLNRLAEDLRESTQVALGVTLSLFVVATVLPETRTTSVLLTEAFFVLWIPFAIGLTMWVWTSRLEPVDTGFRPPPVLGWVLVGAVAFNGLGPYLEFKTANAWNMYSNLAIMDGNSNHLLVRSGLPVDDAHAEPVEVLATDDPALELYVGSGWLLPAPTFADYLADHPRVRVTYRQGGTVREGLGADLGRERPAVLGKFALLRAVDADSPVRCQRVWYPAG